MKARVKATGEIIEIIPYSGFEDYDYYDPETKLPWLKSQLSFDVTDSNPDYWTKLEHQYAGMAMQGMMNNSYLAEEFRKDPNNGIEDMSKIITKAAAVYAPALVEKMKEERR